MQTAFSRRPPARRTPGTGVPPRAPPQLAGAACSRVECSGARSGQAPLLGGEGNAIGTTSLRAQLLPPRPRQELTTLLRAYVTARLAVGRAEIAKVRLEAASVSTRKQ